MLLTVRTGVVIRFDVEKGKGLVQCPASGPLKEAKVAIYSAGARKLVASAYPSPRQPLWVGDEPHPEANLLPDVDHPAWVVMEVCKIGTVPGLQAVRWGIRTDPEWVELWQSLSIPAALEGYGLLVLNSNGLPAHRGVVVNFELTLLGLSIVYRKEDGSHSTYICEVADTVADELHEGVCIIDSPRSGKCIVLTPPANV